ncbi:hypothetical protein [Nocardia sp. NPDC052566]|uniref:hypothetical protein n=1 Tax=Nocardia sp. NPDC052566 TaxID=3364330 RepID=UPI0037CC0C56
MPSIEKRFAELTRAVPIPSPWNLHEYIDAVSLHRARPITLSPMDTSMSAGTGCGTGSGLWIARRDDDIIVYDRRTSSWHAQHIVLHEIGHMLLEHDRLPTVQADLATTTVGLLLPSLSPETIQHVLGRDAYSTRMEREAETFADWAMVHATTPRRPKSPLRGTFFRDLRR